MLEVLAPGLLSSVQDAGRPGLGHLGVPSGGACDSWSLAAANLLVGNPPGAAALEITLLGPELAVREVCVVGLAGADLGARVRESGRPIRPGSTTLLWPGETIEFAGPEGGASGPGARAYLALPGGIDVPPVLGSASTDLRAGFGGIGGRALLAGDVLRGGRAADRSVAGRSWPRGLPEPRWNAPIRVLPGPHVELVAPSVPETLTRVEWLVDPASDRMGLRLGRKTSTPGAAAQPTASQRELVSLPMIWGAVQLPPDGQPIVLLADHPTVGGYPVVAVVIEADLPIVGQLRAADVVRFEWVTIDEAHAELREQRQALERAAALLSRVDPWDELALDARG